MHVCVLSVENSKDRFEGNLDGIVSVAPVPSISAIKVNKQKDINIFIWA